MKEEFTPIVYQPDSYTDFRGIVRNRGLTSELNLQEEVKGRGILELLGMQIEDIAEKRVLDVGVGGGRALHQARKASIDYYAVDILPVVDPATAPSDVAREITGQMQIELTRIAQEYPGRVFAVDATQRFPFRDNEFDVALSAVSMPNYARSPEGAIMSMLEMVRVSREKVVFCKAWHEDNAYGLVSIGIEPYQFNFELKRFLELLGGFGINYSISDSHRIERVFRGTHLDLGNKNQKLLNSQQEAIVAAARDFVSRQELDW